MSEFNILVRGFLSGHMATVSIKIDNDDMKFLVDNEIILISYFVDIQKSLELGLHPNSNGILTIEEEMLSTPTLKAKIPWLENIFVEIRPNAGDETSHTVSRLVSVIRSMKGENECRTQLLQ